LLNIKLEKSNIYIREVFKTTVEDKRDFLANG